MPLHFLPELGPDEILYSILANLFRSLNYPKASTFAKRVIGKSNYQVDIEWLSDLDMILANFPIGHAYDINTLIEMHTLLPLYRPFIFPDNYTFILKGMRDRQCTKVSLPTKMYGIYPYQILNQLYFCDLCAEEDRSELGRSYWHRVHQVLGVVTCPVHHRVLRTVDVDIRHTFHRSLIPLSHDSAKPSRLIELNESDKPYLQNLANDVHWILSNPLTLNLKQTTKKLVNVLWDAGYTTKTQQLRRTKFLADLKAFYPSTVLKQLELNFDFGEKTPWPTKLISNKKMLHPTQYLLVFHFLGYSAEQFFQRPSETIYFGSGPWPCHNAVCPNYKKLVIEQCEENITDKTDIPYGVFKCACGFEYKCFKKVPDQEKFEPDIIIEFGRLWEAKLKKMLAQATLNQDEMATELGVSKTILRTQLDKIGGLTAVAQCTTEIKRKWAPNKQKSQDRVDKYRVLWAAIVATFPNKILFEIQMDLKFARIHNYLKKNDAQWLKGHMPHPATPTIENKELAEMIGLKLRDIFLAERIFFTARELLDTPGEPIRLTKVNAIGPDKISIMPARHPLSHYLLDACVESNFSIFVRRFDWAVKDSVGSTLMDLKRRMNFYVFQHQFGKEFANETWQALLNSKSASGARIHYMLPTAAEDWAIYDKELATKVGLAAHSLKSQDGFPTQITYVSLAYHLDVIEKLLYHFDMLPQTQKAIDALVETHSDYLTRILAWAKAYFIQREAYPDYKRFCRIIGLKHFSPDDFSETIVENEYEFLKSTVDLKNQQKYPLPMIDKLFAGEIEKALVELKNTPSLPQQINETSIRIYLQENALHLYPYWDVFLKFSNGLPKTTALINESSESLEDFVIRKLRWAEKQYRDKEICPIPSELVRFAAVEKFTSQIWVKEVVGEILDSLSTLPTVEDLSNQKFWRDRDTLLSGFVEPIVNEIKMHKTPLVQVTMKEIARRLKKETGFSTGNHFKNVPITRNIVHQYVESSEAFVLRKILSTFNYYEELMVAPTLEEFLQKTDVSRWMYKKPYYKTAVDRALENLQRFDEKTPLNRESKTFLEEG